MSTIAYQNYSYNRNQIPNNNQGYPSMQAMPQMVPMGSPMFQPMPQMTPAPLPQTQFYLPQSIPQITCGFGQITLAPAANFTAVPVMPCGSFDSTSPMISMNSVDSMCSIPSNDMHMGNGLNMPFHSVGSAESFTRSPSPAVGLGTSMSPQPYQMLPPMVSFVPAAHPAPTLTNSSFTVTMTQDPTMPNSVQETTMADPNFLGYRGSSAPRSRSPSRSLSRDRSMSDYSVASEGEREYANQIVEVSKRELVNKAFAKLQAMFGNAFDQNGNRGENILRLKVKTRTALEQIVPFIEFCQLENLIVSVSCPISTKKGRQQVRGFLAYLQMKNAEDTTRVEELIQIFNNLNGSPFNTWHRNPPSTWKKQALN